jgi:hypothetical protein
VVGVVLAQLPQHLLALVVLGLIVAAPVPLSLAFASSHLGRRPAGRADWAIVAATSWLSLQTFLVLGLGLLRRLTTGHVLGAEIILLGLGLVVLVRRRDMLAMLPTGRGRPAGADAGMLVALVTVGVWLLHHTITTPVREYDSLAYHLPAVASWYRTGTLDMLGQGSVDYYPYDFELLALLFVLPFRGHFAVGLAQLLAWSLFGLAIYATATRLGARSLHGLVAAALALMQPIVLRLGGDTLQVDLAFAAAFMVTVYVGLGYASRQLHWSLFVLSGAWLAGTKTSGLGYIGLLVLMTLIARRVGLPWTPPRTGIEPRGPPTVVVGLSLLVGLTTAGFWYARNLITAGNPLGMVGVSLFGVPIFHGPMSASELSRSSLAAVFRVSDTRDWAIFLKQLAVNLGLPFALLAVAAGALVLAGAGRAPFWRQRAAMVVLALFVSCAALYASTPFSGDDVGTYGWRVTPWIGQGLRYALPAVGVLAVAAALGLARFGERDTVLVGVATMAGVLSLPHDRLLGSVMLAAAWAWLLGRRWLPRWGRRAVSYGATAILIVLSVHLRDLKDEAYAQMFPVAAYVDRHVADGEKIGLLVTNRAYTFFGTRLTADVAFVPTGETDPSRWVRLLRARDVRFVGVGPILEDWWLSSNEIRWLDGDHQAFERVHGTDYRKGSVLYRVRGTTAAAGPPR